MVPGQALLLYLHAQERRPWLGTFSTREFQRQHEEAVRQMRAMGMKV
jgi:hypothetical protein